MLLKKLTGWLLLSYIMVGSLLGLTIWSASTLIYPAIALFAVITILYTFMLFTMNQKKKDVQALREEKHEFELLCEKYKSEADYYKSQSNQYIDEYNKLSIDKTDMSRDVKYIMNNIPLMDGMLESISERTLNETEELITKMNDISENNLKTSDQAISSLNKMIDSNGSTKSFQFVVDSTQRLKKEASSLDQLLKLNEREKEYLEELDSKVSKIKEVAKQIENISEKTRVLSINAAIEAAKSGKAGKGFSVIVEQIKKLSSEAKGGVSLIHETTANISIAINKLNNQSVEMTNKLNTQVNTTKNEADQIFDIISYSHKELTENANFLKESSKKWTDSLNNAVYIYLQSQDILSQQVSHIQAILTMINTKIDDIKEYIGSDEGEISLNEIKKQVILDAFSHLTMEYERDWIKKIAVDYLKLDSTSFIDEKTKKITYQNRTKEIMGDEHIEQDNIVLF